MGQTGLFVVATPIGNLEDISLRALRILSEVDCIAAEDTRHTRILLEHHSIGTRMLALHEHNEEKLAPRLVERLNNGESIALVSDAGTPLVSDPGYRLVRLCGEAGIPVYVVPGPSALTAALSVSGISVDRFCFEGFLPAKPAARRKRLEQLVDEERSMVFYESSHRIEACVNDMCDILGGDREAAVCRELTKRFETVKRAALSELSSWLADDSNQRKGEFVILVAAQDQPRAQKFAQALSMAESLQEYLPASQAARAAARYFDVARREVYAAMEKDTGV
ncbi:MAG: 16S rRNA (cytidine(1402)-2'-O)-methyltransferase [Haliea sp.]|jgi:16S rRNA (cytidine1402-2'-O)-methyltransferase|nr:16S rRNA (cytidine(1402)-2'-O)-methyltransferase [Haliea sp.]